MNNKGLVADYLKRSANRIEAIKTLHDLKSYADVVRESQEVIELSLKALLRNFGIEVPRLHDVSDVMLQEMERFPEDRSTTIRKMAKISRRLRRDRELSFYGAEDLTPSEFYHIEEADEALTDAIWVLGVCREMCG